MAASLVQFGLLGTLLYARRALRNGHAAVDYYRRAASIQGAALASAGLGVFATSWLSVVTAGPIGVCLWMITGLAIADREMRRRPAPLPVRRRPWPLYVPREPRRRPWPPSGAPEPAVRVR